MFGSIAPSYDLLNHLLSLNIDHYWRWRTTRLVPPADGQPILDLCTGTGDLALAYDRAAGGSVPVVGTDFCLPMLLPAREKARRAGAAGRVRFLEADTQLRQALALQPGNAGAHDNLGNLLQQTGRLP